MRFDRCLSVSATLLTVILLGSTNALASYRLVELEGTVQIKRSGQSNYRTARSGMRLNLGDLLKAANGAHARIKCANLTTVWTLRSGQERGVVWGCPPNDDPVLRIGEQDDNASGGSDPRIPYVMSPRRTAVLDEYPTLRWNTVEGATSYTVQVVGPDVNWEVEINGTEVRYAGSPLTAGLEYRVIVEADNGQSSQLDAGAETATFELLYVEDIATVQEDITKLAEAELLGEAQILALADIYIREDLFMDAIATLEPLATAGTDTFQVYQDLGDIYRYIGLNLLAEERYDQAITIASNTDNFEGLANAQAGLAEVKVMLDQSEAAIALLMQAKAGYEELENTDRAAEVEERLEELSVS